MLCMIILILFLVILYSVPDPTLLQNKTTNIKRCVSRSASRTSFIGDSRSDQIPAAGSVAKHQFFLTDECLANKVNF